MELFRRKSFAGELEIDDPNLNFTNSVDYRSYQKMFPSFNIVGDLSAVQFKSTKLC